MVHQRDIENNPLVNVEMETWILTM